VKFTLRRGTGAHRSASPRQLRAENRTLRARQDAADDFFARLIEDRDAVHAAYETARQRYVDAELVVVCQQHELGLLEAKVTALEADLANLRAISAPAGTRDVDPDDQPTEPTGIPVQTLHEALALVGTKALAVRIH
jgi:hypothetical protein